MATPFKRDYDSEFYTTLKTRAADWVEGKMEKTLIRNHGFCKIKGNGATYPREENDFASRFGKIKPGPILTNVTITHGGDFGLVLELKATIQCHTRSQFIQVEKDLLFPGTDITLEFGYSSKVHSNKIGKTHSFKGFKTATYGFNTTQEGFWIVELKAVAPGIGMESLDINVTYDDKGRFYMGEGGKKYKVTGMMQLIESDAQTNGEVALDTWEDGHVIRSFKGYNNPGTTGENSIFMKIYTGEHLVSEKTSLEKKALAKISSGAGIPDDSNINEPQVYVTLSYIVHRLLNDETFGIYKKIDTKMMPKVKINFHPQYRVSYPDVDIRSAYPTDILFMGGSSVGQATSNYKNSEDKGKDFAKGGEIVSKYNSGPPGRCTIYHPFILVNTTVIANAIGYNRDGKKNAEDPTVQEHPEVEVDVKKFLGEIFTAISRASGGAIKLRLACDPNIHSGKASDAETHSMIIVDENNGYKPDPLKVVVFDPLQYDGNTRTCTITSDVGSAEYKASLFSACMKKSKPLDKVFERYSEPEKKWLLEKTRSTELMEELVFHPGSLGDNCFSAQDMQSLEQMLGTLHKAAPKQEKSDMLIYPGIGIDLEIDGTFGIYPGNGIMTTQMTPRYFDANAYFFVKSVTHTFNSSDSDWKTNISGQLAFHDNVVYQKLMG